MDNQAYACASYVKFAYARTVDKGNYYKINTVFKNESSVDELNKAILK